MSFIRLLGPMGYDLEKYDLSASVKEQIFSFFREKELLLILDNFEHLVDAADQLSELLESAPDLNMLITSRERLRLRWEHVLEIQGLPFLEE